MFYRIRTHKLTFEGQDCTLVHFQNLTQVRQNMELKAENTTIQLMAQTLTHDVLTPLKCAN